MKTTIIKNTLLGVSVIALIGILFGAYIGVTESLSFFNDKSFEPLTSKMVSDLEKYNFSVQTKHSMVEIVDVELHYLKKSFGENHGDTTITLKYITLKNSRHQLEVSKNGLPVDKNMGPEAINAGYHQLESLHSIPFKNIDTTFWKRFLLSHLIVKVFIYSCIMLLIFLITKNAFKTSPFTHRIKNKFYLLAGFMLLLVFVGWIFNDILSGYLLENHQISVSFDPFNTWFLMGLLTLFIATIFDYGIRLQKEQDLTI